MDKLFRAFMALFYSVPGVPSPKRPIDLPDEAPSRGEPAWLKLGRAEIGVKEIPGTGNNPAILKYYADAGHPEINHEDTPWCAAWTGAMLERSGVPSSKALNARSYLTWGKPVKKPYPGCVAVFSRGDPRGWEGHVGFYLGEEGGQIKLLAGNQGDAVSVGSEPASRLLGYREPLKGTNSTTLKAQTAGLLLGDGLTAASLGGKMVESLPDALALGTTVQSLATYWPWFAVIGITISILARIVTIYARLNTWQEKGA